MEAAAAEAAAVEAAAFECAAAFETTIAAVEPAASAGASSELTKSSTESFKSPELAAAPDPLSLDRRRLLPPYRCRHGYQRIAFDTQHAVEGGDVCEAG